MFPKFTIHVASYNETVNVQDTMFSTIMLLSFGQSLFKGLLKIESTFIYKTRNSIICNYLFTSLNKWMSYFFKYAEI